MNKTSEEQGCDRGKGCYSKSGKCLCVLGCDCACHYGWTDEGMYES